MLHTLHDDLNDCLLVRLIRQDVLLPYKLCGFRNIHLLCIHILALVSAARLTKSNLVPIKYYSRVSIIWHFEWGIHLWIELNVQPVVYFKRWQSDPPSRTYWSVTGTVCVTALSVLGVLLLPVMAFIIHSSSLCIAGDYLSVTQLGTSGKSMLYLPYGPRKLSWPSNSFCVKRRT